MSEKYDIPVSRDELLFDVEMALCKAEKLWPKGRRAGRHDQFKPISAAVVDHLALCGVRCFRGPPIGAASASDLVVAKQEPPGSDEEFGSDQPTAVLKRPSRQILSRDAVVAPARNEVG